MVEKAENMEKAIMENTMLFNSSEMEKLRIKYKECPDWKVPYIVYLDRAPELAEERKLIETVLGMAPSKINSEWINNLLNENILEHNGDWFEIRLFDWLCNNFTQVDIKPKILGVTPDFCLKSENLNILIEAYVHFSHSNLVSSKILDQIKFLLKKIKKPYYFSIDEFSLKSFPLDSDCFSNKVKEWLDSNPESQLVYEEPASRNYLRLSAERCPGKKILPLISTPIKYDSDSITKSNLVEKTNKYKNLSEAGYPYIIAIYLRSINESVEELIEAMFGKCRVSISKSNQEREVKPYFDKIGLFFCEGEIKHRHISGMLAFKSFLDSPSKIMKLESWYIENPDAILHIPAEIFPIETRLYLFNKNEKCMEWVR